MRGSLQRVVKDKFVGRVLKKYTFSGNCIFQGASSHENTQLDSSADETCLCEQITRKISPLTAQAGPALLIGVKTVGPPVTRSTVA